LTVHRRIKHVVMFCVFFVLMALPFEVIWAQDGEGTPTPIGEEAAQPDSDIPIVHVVQEGETLYVIAEQYGTTIDTLQILNNISDPSLLFVGQQLVIPGGGGDVVASVHTVRIGDTLSGIAAEFNTTKDSVASSNGVINPDRLVAGRPLTVISRTGTGERQALTGIPYNVNPGDTLLTIAAEYGLSPLEIVELNQLSYPARLVPGQRLRLPGEDRFQYLPAPWKRVELAPVSINQGDSAAIYVESTLPGMPFGRLAGQTLQFASYHDGYLALAGLDAFTESGFHELRLDGAGDQPWQPFSQEFDLQSSGYGVQYIDVPDELSALLAPEVRADEDAFLATLYTQFTSEVLWDGPFTLPITGTVISAPYGDGRSYDQGPVEIFHTGIDFVGFVGTPIFAPAAGTVIFSDTLQIRGNTLILDHGLGLMSGYYHLSAIHVDIGDTVEAGQHIADGGSTGLSTGPHLHWDMRILNAAVDGLRWVEEDIVQNLAQ
jgi:murein DD-endopeptidase MepM/ murein hydrolase activator NlpD